MVVDAPDQGKIEVGDDLLDDAQPDIGAEGGEHPVLADEMADRDGGVDHEHAADRADEHQEDELEEEGDLADADIVRQEIGQLAEEFGDLPKQI